MTPSPQRKPRSHAHFDGMAWPLPNADLAWRMRYAEGRTVTIEDMLVAASIIDAYDMLIDSTRARREQVVRELRDAAGKLGA